jgi:enoyl-CoA hydratase/carnithine racemase
MVDYKNWLIEREEGIFWFRLNRLDKKNAFSTEMILELENILDKIEKDDSIRVAVLSTTSDKVFCAGADMKMFLDVYSGDPFENGKQMSIDSQRIFARLEQLKKPVIAAIKGLNLTAGLELSMCCDLIYAADNAQIGQIETKYGITPGGGGTQRLVRLVGPLKAREMIYMAKIIGAEEALQIGLVSAVVPVAELDDYVRNICKKMMKNSARAIKESKFLIQKAIFSNNEGFKEENRIFGEDFASMEPKERLSQFFTTKK